jgi:hypothetical protein
VPQINSPEEFALLLAAIKICIGSVLLYPPRASAT